MLRQCKLMGGLSQLNAAQQLHPGGGMSLGGGILLHGQLKVSAEIVGIIAVWLHAVVGKAEESVDLAVIRHCQHADAQLCRPGASLQDAFVFPVRRIVGVIVAIYQHSISSFGVGFLYYIIYLRKGKVAAEKNCIGAQTKNCAKGFLFPWACGILI